MTIKDIGKALGNVVLHQVGRASSRVQESRPLAVDTLESDDAYLLVFDAAGATQSDVQVRYAEGEVLVRIDRFREYHEGFEMVFPGRGLGLDGTVELPDDAIVDPEAATATLRTSGILEIQIPKRASGSESDDDSSDRVPTST